MSPYPNCHVNRRDPLSPSRQLRSSAEPFSHPDRGISSEDQSEVAGVVAGYAEEVA